MVARARAVMSGTKLLLLDEPFEGLSPAMGDKFAGTIQELQKDGLSVLLVESEERYKRIVGPSSDQKFKKNLVEGMK